MSILSRPLTDQRVVSSGLVLDIIFPQSSNEMEVIRSWQQFTEMEETRSQRPTDSNRSSLLVKASKESSGEQFTRCGGLARVPFTDSTSSFNIAMMIQIVCIIFVVVHTLACNRVIYMDYTKTNIIVINTEQLSSLQSIGVVVRSFHFRVLLMNDLLEVDEVYADKRLSR